MWLTDDYVYCMLYSRGTCNTKITKILFIALDSAQNFDEFIPILDHIVMIYKKYLNQQPKQKNLKGKRTNQFFFI